MTRGRRCCSRRSRCLCGTPVFRPTTAYQLLVRRRRCDLHRCIRDVAIRPERLPLLRTVRLSGSRFRSRSLVTAPVLWLRFGYRPILGGGRERARGACDADPARAGIRDGGSRLGVAPGGGGFSPGSTAGSPPMWRCAHARSGSWLPFAQVSSSRGLAAFGAVCFSGRPPVLLAAMADELKLCVYLLGSDRPKIDRASPNV